jgi:hypothetical protein
MSRRGSVGVVSVIGLLAFLFGFLNLLPCLHAVVVFSTPVGDCWSDFLLALVGALLFTRPDESD